jgi:anti-sigma28 factor (negative regulator of flagellin synthesis)
MVALAQSVKDAATSYLTSKVELANQKHSQAFREVLEQANPCTPEGVSQIKAAIQAIEYQ